MFLYSRRKEIRLNRPALLVFLCLVVIPSTFPGAFAQDSISFRQGLLKGKGHLQSISISNRTAVIDGRVFQLAEDLTVRDKSDSIMMPHQYGSLSFADVIEYTKIRGTNIIKEIKILRYAS